MANCLVTGGAGFIGSHVVDQLIDKGHTVYVVDNLSAGNLKHVNRKAKFLSADINDPYFWQDLKPTMDYVFHLAALPRVQFSIENPIQTHEANLTGTLRVLEYCRRVQAKIIFSSSSSIFKGDTLPTKENDELQPRSPYAMHKYMSELYIRLYNSLFDVPYVNLRYFNVYGERASVQGSYPLVIALFLQQRANKEPLTITNDGKQSRDFTYVKDVAQANLLAMDWENGDYNIGAGQNYSVNHIAKIIGGETKNIGPRIGEPFATLADNSKATQAGWRQSTTLEEWLHDQD